MTQEPDRSSPGYSGGCRFQATAAKLLAATVALCLPGAVLGQSYEVLHAFALDGNGPLSPLIQAADGQFYGTTNTGGAIGFGVVFKMDSAGNLTTLHSFAGSPSDGGSPIAGLIQATDGNFYGTTAGGGDSGNGTVFRTDSSGDLTTLHSFDGSDGSYPAAGLIQAADGNFYGTTKDGGALRFGTVFRMDPAGNVTTLHSFAGTPSGAYSSAGLIQGIDGNFYGTTTSGGSGSCAGGCGTVFRMDSSGNLITLHSFAGPPGEGSLPIYAGLVQAKDGNFYGTTNNGGTGGKDGKGTVFRIDLSGNLTTLHSFGGAPSDGGFPYAGLIQASDGNLYGTTTSGGSSNSGTVFKVDSTGSLTTLHSFTDSGLGSAAGLMQATDRNFYGTTVRGTGTTYYGTVFRMDSAGDLTTLHSFGYSGGAGPHAGLIQATDGNFYGTTSLGGATNHGVVFKMDSSGNVSALHSFAGPLRDGVGPYASLIQANDGNFYGTTHTGGASNYGTVFKMDSEGRLTTLHSFGYFDGADPQANLVQATDGNLYGLTSSGGASAAGTVFKMDSSGNLTTLHTFDGSDGAAPLGGLIQAKDGDFYGTTSSGTVFRMDSFGNLTTLHSFGGSDGAAPLGGLIQAKDGDFYGTTSGGGSGCRGGCGTVFKMDSNGNLTTLHSFGGAPSDGSSPYAGLIQASDGNFYGTTYWGGARNGGTIFGIDSSGNLTTLFSFAGIYGAYPESTLIQATDGDLYGTTYGGGYGVGGVVFRLSLALPILRLPKPPPPRLVPFRPGPSVALPEKSVDAAGSEHPALVRSGSGWVVCSKPD